MPVFRPIPQLDPATRAEGFSLAGTLIRFSMVEVLERGRPPHLMPARELDTATLTRLTAPRAPLCERQEARPQIMGILNVTPDSFSDGGQFFDAGSALRQGQAMMAAGADLLDIGGESTRPGARAVPAEQEKARVAPLVAALRDAGIALPISVDTRKADVAEAALAAGADLVNDVSAMTFDARLAPLVAEAGVPLCLMHAQGDPATMQDDPQYDNVVLDVYDFLEERVKAAEAAGISRDRILVDPGLGFGKTLDHNLALIARISAFHGLGCRILLGASRKRFIGTIGEEPVAARRVPGSVAVALAVASQGVQVIRVHDVAETRQALRMWQALAV